MPETRVGARLTDLHSSAQTRLSADTVRQLAQLWALLTVERSLSESEWVAATSTLLAARHGVSSAMARTYYQAYRRAEAGVALSVRQFGQPAFNTVRVEGHARTYVDYWHNLGAAGLTVAQAARRAGEKMAADLVEEALDGGRYTIIDTVRSDPQAVGWYRVSDGDPCAFCALHLSRGIVYKSESSANFRSHPQCGCTVKAAYRDEKYGDARSKELGDLYRASTRGHSDKLNAFRRAYERPHLHS